MIPSHVDYEWEHLLKYWVTEAQDALVKKTQYIDITSQSWRRETEIQESFLT